MGKNNKWSAEVIQMATNLHSELSLNNQNWHKYKSDHERRAAESISGAIVMLVSGGKKSEIEALVDQSMKWIKHEVSAPSCPHK